MNQAIATLSLLLGAGAPLAWSLAPTPAQSSDDGEEIEVKESTFERMQERAERQLERVQEALERQLERRQESAESMLERYEEQLRALEERIEQSMEAQAENSDATLEAYSEAVDALMEAGSEAHEAGWQATCESREALSEALAAMHERMAAQHEDGQSAAQDWRERYESALWHAQEEMNEHLSNERERVQEELARAQESLARALEAAQAHEDQRGEAMVRVKSKDGKSLDFVLPEIDLGDLDIELPEIEIPEIHVEIPDLSGLNQQLAQLQGQLQGQWAHVDGEVARTLGGNLVLRGRRCQPARVRALLSQGQGLGQGQAFGLAPVAPAAPGGGQGCCACCSGACCAGGGQAGTPAPTVWSFPGAVEMPAMPDAPEMPETPCEEAQAPAEDSVSFAFPGFGGNAGWGTANWSSATPGTTNPDPSSWVGFTPGDAAQWTGAVATSTPFVVSGAATPFGVVTAPGTTTFTTGYTAAAPAQDRELAELLRAMRSEMQALRSELTHLRQEVRVHSTR